MFMCISPDFRTYASCSPPQFFLWFAYFRLLAISFFSTQSFGSSRVPSHEYIGRVNSKNAHFLPFSPSCMQCLIGESVRLYFL